MRHGTLWDAPSLLDPQRTAAGPARRDQPGLVGNPHVSLRGPSRGSRNRTRYQLFGTLSMGRRRSTQPHFTTRTTRGQHAIVVSIALFADCQEIPRPIVSVRYPHGQQQQQQQQSPEWYPFSHGVVVVSRRRFPTATHVSSIRFVVTECHGGSVPLQHGRDSHTVWPQGQTGHSGRRQSQCGRDCHWGHGTATGFHAFVVIGIARFRVERRTQHLPTECQPQHQH